MMAFFYRDQVGKGAVGNGGTARPEMQMILEQTF